MLFSYQVAEYFYSVKQNYAKVVMCHLRDPEFKVTKKKIYNRFDLVRFSKMYFLLLKI